MSERQLYVLVDPTDGVVRYVGQTTKQLPERLTGHLANAKRSQRDSKLYVWLRSLPVPPVIKHVAWCSDAWQTEERALIAEYRAAGADLCNGTIGGERGRTAELLPMEHFEQRFREIFATKGIGAAFKYVAGVRRVRPELFED